MAFKSGFFNSIGHDRKYDAEDFSRLVNALVTDGIIATKGEQFMTVAGEGLSVNVKSGFAWFNSTWSMGEDLTNLTLKTADATRPRTDAIVIDINSDPSVRKNQLLVITGVPSSSASKPLLINDEHHHQHAIAYVTIPAGATAITAANIDIRVGQDDCPFAMGRLESISVSDLFNAWDAEFNEWFENLKSQLGDNVVTNLQKQIDERVKIADKATPEDITAGTPDKWVDAAGIAPAGSVSADPTIFPNKNYIRGLPTYRNMLTDYPEANARIKGIYGCAMSMVTEDAIVPSGTVEYVHYQDRLSEDTLYILIRGKNFPNETLGGVGVRHILVSPKRIINVNDLDIPNKVASRYSLAGDYLFYSSSSLGQALGQIHVKNMNTMSDEATLSGSILSKNMYYSLVVTYTNKIVLFMSDPGSVIMYDINTKTFTSTLLSFNNNEAFYNAIAVNEFVYVRYSNLYYEINTDNFSTRELNRSDAFDGPIIAYLNGGGEGYIESIIPGVYVSGIGAMATRLLDTRTNPYTYTQSVLGGSLDLIEQDGSFNGYLLARRTPTDSTTSNQYVDCYLNTGRVYSYNLPDKVNTAGGVKIIRQDTDQFGPTSLSYVNKQYQRVEYVGVTQPDTDGPIHIVRFYRSGINLCPGPQTNTIFKIT